MKGGVKGKRFYTVGPNIGHYYEIKRIYGDIEEEEYCTVAEVEFFEGDTAIKQRKLVHFLNDLEAFPGKIIK